MYDKTGQDIIGPLLSVKELRDLGVTLHLLLHSPRSVLCNGLKRTSMNISFLETPFLMPPVFTSVFPQKTIFSEFVR